MAVFRRYIHLYYVRRLKSPPSTTGVAPDVSVPGISRRLPRNNLILRDSTFRAVDWIYYDPVRRIAIAVFVPGALNAVSKVHPSRNPRLRDTTFRPPDRLAYQPKRVLPPAEFVPGIFSATHPRLRNNWARGIEFRYYKVKRVLPTITPSAPPDVSFNAVSRVHPSRSLVRRQRFVDYSYYQPKRAIYPSLFVAGILILVSKVHPSRNMRQRDATFRPPFLDYYQPRRANAFNLQIVSTGLTEVLFKGMWRGMYKRMR